jgi:hypothetical protein
MTNLEAYFVDRKMDVLGVTQPGRRLVDVYEIGTIQFTARTGQDVHIHSRRLLCLLERLPSLKEYRRQYNPIARTVLVEKGGEIGHNVLVLPPGRLGDRELTVQLDRHSECDSEGWSERLPRGRPVLVRRDSFGDYNI